jgi:DNA-binding response OmpR family regulator
MFMSETHYLLISNQDSPTRVVLPHVFAQQARLSMAANPFAALAVIREANPDALLVAFDEEDQDAAVMCKTLRRRSNLPIVMVVNGATRDQVTRGYRLGADAHVEIPCDPRVFRARVAAVLREHAVKVAS